MATLGAPVKVPDFGLGSPNVSWRDAIDAEDKWEQEWLANHRYITFPVADGHALYEVRGTSRYTLHHVPIGDAWQVPYAMIRGLRKADIENMVEG